MAYRTDLALESEQRANVSGGLAGIKKQERNYPRAGLEVTEIDVLTREAAEALGKPVGRYITVKCTRGRLSDCVCDTAEQTECLAAELSRLVKLPRRILAAGLGSKAVTPDSLGPAAASGIIATRHLKRLAKDLDTSELSEVSVISAGVMAQTGIESAAVVKALCDEVRPELVIVIDALACSELEHLGSTVQLCNTGISPGSGVGNARAELSEATLGVPVCAVGIPTVTDCSVIAEAAGGKSLPEHLGMIVTPKDIDLLIKRSASLLSAGINRALHPTLSPEELAILSE